MASEGPARGSKRWRSLRLLLSTVLIGLILWRVDLSAFRFHLRQADLLWLGAAAVLIAIDRAVMAIKWGYLLGGLGQRPPLVDLLRTYLLTGLAGASMQWQLGGDLARIGATGRRMGRTAVVAASVGIERGTGFWALGLLATGSLIALYLRHDLGTAGITVAPALLVTASAALGPPLLLSRSVRRLARRAAAHVRPARLRQALLDADTAIESGRVQRLLPVFALATLVEQTVPIWVLALLGRSFSVPLPLYDIFCVMPVIAFASRMPFSLDFVGLREGLYVLLLGVIHVPAGAALLLALAARTLDLAVLGIGSIALGWIPGRSERGGWSPQ